MLRKIIFLPTICYFSLTGNSLSAETGGMPQLNPEFWISQIFWLVITFGGMFFVLSKFVLPNISANLESRKSQILVNIETADKQREDSEKKLKEFEKIILEAKNQAKNIINNAKKDILSEISNKKDLLEDEINKEINSIEKEISKLKSKSPERINQIAVETSSELIKQLIGTEVNKSNISAIVEDLSKKEKGKYYDI